MLSVTSALGAAKSANELSVATARRHAILTTCWGARVAVSLSVTSAGLRQSASAMSVAVRTVWQTTRALIATNALGTEAFPIVPTDT